MYSCTPVKIYLYSKTKLTNKKKDLNAKLAKERHIEKIFVILFRVLLTSVLGHS